MSSQKHVRLCGLSRVSNYFLGVVLQISLSASSFSIYLCITELCPCGCRPSQVTASNCCRVFDSCVDRSSPMNSDQRVNLFWPSSQLPPWPPQRPLPACWLLDASALLSVPRLFFRSGLFLTSPIHGHHQESFPQDKPDSLCLEY